MAKMLRVKCEILDTLKEKTKEINKIRVMKELEPVTDTDLLHYVTIHCIGRLTTDEKGELLIK